MATKKFSAIYERQNGDGTSSYLAMVRIARFRPVSKSFNEAEFGSRREAKQAAHDWKQQLEKTLREQRARGGVHRDVATLTLRELIDRYLQDPKTQALATYDGVQMQLAWWVNRLGSERALGCVSPLLILEGRRALLDQGRGAATANRYLAAMRSVVNWARACGLLPPSVVWPPRMLLTEPKHRERFLSDDELASVLKAARAHSPLMHAAVMFAVGVGCRQGEQLRTRWGDIDSGNGTVAVHVSKTQTSRRAHLPLAVIEALDELRNGVAMMPKRFVFAHDDGSALNNFELIYRWRRVRKAAGLPTLRWHDLRHASASFLIQGGSTLAEVAAQLGHKSIVTSKRYAHLVPGAKPTGADKLNEKLRG